MSDPGATPVRADQLRPGDVIDLHDTEYQTHQSADMFAVVDEIEPTGAGTLVTTSHGEFEMPDDEAIIVVGSVRRR